MRESLQKTAWHTYGLSTTDYKYIFNLVTEIIKDRNKVVELEANKLRQRNVDSEAASDLRYYNHIGNIFLFEGAIWRLQGIYEGLLKQKYFRDKTLGGLRQKLNYSKKLGYTINPTDEEELLLWSEFRNALSHFPPEQYRPANLEEKDISDYIELLNRCSIGLEQDEG